MAEASIEAVASSETRRTTRRLPVGAELVEGGVSFRVWAPAAQQVAVELLDGRGQVRQLSPLDAEANGYFSATVAEAEVGTRYRLRVNRGAFPDPASRFQPDGPHGPSQVVDAQAFAWTDANWRGRRVDELVIYELHLGTFTAEGTWRAAAARLSQLAELGITMIEVMPVADFPGKFGWGYDGVNLFAPSRLYGSPDDVRAFVDRAHELGLAVILDVVYNHIGPDGNYLREFSAHYFSSKYGNEWGEALNFDGEQSASVREFFISNARYWIDEYHFDGLRLDATQQVFDSSERHVLTEIGEAMREAGRGRIVHAIAENETQEARLVRPISAGGCGLTAIWNDDFHHVARIAATGRAEAYYNGYRGTAQEFVSSAKHGFLYQGQWYRWQGKRRGRPAFDLQPRHFVHFIENHDQVANSLHGRRLHQLMSPARWRALTAVLLLGPQLPMLFQGQEFSATAPFLYFADHDPDLAKLVAQGRGKFLDQFPSIATRAAHEALPPPHAHETFRAAKLDWSEWERNRLARRLHADLLRLRREESAIARPARIDGAVLGERAFVLRYFDKEGGDRLLVVNLGSDLVMFAPSEPLLAPVEAGGWRIAWSSESVAYGGGGTPPLETRGQWILPGESAVWLSPHEDSEPPVARLSEKD